MKYRKILAGVVTFSLAACISGCGGKDSSEVPAPLPPSPVEASDPNTVTFDDDNFLFAAVISDDDASAAGELSVVEVQGNKMLKFTDNLEVPLDIKVQKICINSAMLVGTENLSKIRRIEFDLYADAISDKYVNEDGESIKAPGWIGGGGGTITANTNSDGDAKWYDFQEFGGGEYTFDMSGAVHGEFKFLLADAGECWSEEMLDANFLIMRWGIANDSNLYLDNIVFYDKDNNSIPIQDIEAQKLTKEKAEAEK